MHFKDARHRLQLAWGFRHRAPRLARSYLRQALVADLIGWFRAWQKLEGWIGRFY